MSNELYEEYEWLEPQNFVIISCTFHKSNLRVLVKAGRQGPSHGYLRRSGKDAQVRALNADKNPTFGPSCIRSWYCYPLTEFCSMSTTETRTEVYLLTFDKVFIDSLTQSLYVGCVY